MIRSLIFMFLSGLIALPSLAAEFPKAIRKPAGDAYKDFENSPKATPVAKGTTSTLYRFVDTIEGIKMVCYFTDTIYEGGRGSGGGGVHCNPLNKN